MARMVVFRPARRVTRALASSAMRGLIQRGRSRRPFSCASRRKKPSARWRSDSTCASTSRPSTRAALSSRSTSRQRSSKRCTESCCPKYWVATSSSRCASSTMSVSYSGMTAPKLDSFTARSAQSRWWFTTTTSASSARWRMRVTQQVSKSEHDWPMQFSLPADISRQKSTLSGRSSISARSPRVASRAPSPRPRGTAGSRRGAGSCPPARRSGSAGCRGSSRGPS